MRCRFRMRASATSSITLFATAAWPSDELVGVAAEQQALPVGQRFPRFRVVHAPGIDSTEIQREGVGQQHAFQTASTRSCLRNTEAAAVFRSARSRAARAGTNPARTRYRHRRTGSSASPKPRAPARQALGLPSDSAVQRRRGDHHGPAWRASSAVRSFGAIVHHDHRHSRRKLPTTRAMFVLFIARRARSQ